MRVTSSGRHLSVRGRQVYMTRQDGVDFLVAVAAVFPEARFFNYKSLRKKPRLEEISRDAIRFPKRLFPEVEIFFFGPDFVPEVAPSDDPRVYQYTVKNFPRLRASLRVDYFRRNLWKELGRRISRMHEGMLNANHHADGPGAEDEKRVIDKLFRVHRKLVGNRVVPYDLKTGDVAGPEETDYNWHGIDVARQCLTKEDHYLYVRPSPDEATFWGYKPVRVPGEQRRGPHPHGPGSPA